MLRSTTMRKQRGKVVRQVASAPPAPAPLLRRRLAAIQTRNKWQFLRVNAEVTEAVRDILRDAVDALGVWEQTAVMPHVVIKAAGFFEGHNAAWALEEQVTVEALKIAASKRRPRNEAQDSVCVEILNLWSQLAGKRPTEPASWRKEPDKPGGQATFLADALRIYGLGHAHPGRGSATWRRILAGYREQFS